MPGRWPSLAYYKPVFVSTFILFLFLQGGTVCCFDFEETLPSHVQSGSAFFGNLATVKVERLGNSLVGRRIPGMSEKIILQSKQG